MRVLSHKFTSHHFTTLRSKFTSHYFARLLFPDDAELLMKHINELIVCTKQACFGQDVSAEGPLGPVGADLHQQQSEFPKHMNGIGLHSLFKKSLSVHFVAALLNALPKFLDSTDRSKPARSRELARASSGRGLVREVQLQPRPRAVPCEWRTHRGALQGVLGALSRPSRRHPARQHCAISQPTRMADRDGRAWSRT